MSGIVHNAKLSAAKRAIITNQEESTNDSSFDHDDEDHSKIYHGNTIENISAGDSSATQNEIKKTVIRPALGQKIRVLADTSHARNKVSEIASQLALPARNKTYTHKLKASGEGESQNVEDGALKRKKKRRKRKFLSICTTCCKYDVVRRVAARFGMRDVREDYSWNLFWTDLSVSVERAKEMKRFQKINHFPGMLEICRKDLLARNLNRMLKIFPKDYNFFPMTWCLPHDHGEFHNYARTKRNKTYICKPDTGCQGRGIYLTKNYKDIKPYDHMICQIYLPKPLLLDGLKFDLRVYTLITSCDPLRIFVYNDGLARFATSPYKEPTMTNASNVFMHLTNYAVNKHSRTYKVDDEAGTKRRISTLNRSLQNLNIDVQALWTRIDDVIIKTVIAAHPILKHSYHACFPSHDFAYACFELLGFDVIIDHNLKPYLLEVNHSPSFHTDAKIDRDIKEGLLVDTFEIINLGQTDKKKIIEEDRRRVRDRLLQGVIPKESITSELGEDLYDPHKAQTEWEDSHLGNFRCVYPGNHSEKYTAYFNQNASSLFQDTAASRAREECARNQRIEQLAKLNLEHEKRLGLKKMDSEKIRPESPNPRKTAKKLKTTLSCMTKKHFLLHPRKLLQGTQEYDKLNSFNPDVISEEEEKERKTGLAQREFLIRSYGIVEQIYMAMLKNGTLREPDKKKYASFSKVNALSEINPAVSKILPPVIISGGATGDKQPSVLPPFSSAPGHQNKGNLLNIYDLNVRCNNLPIATRPEIPQTSLLDDRNRFTKAHIARSLTNTVKLQGLERREIWHQLHNS